MSVLQDQIPHKIGKFRMKFGCLILIISKFVADKCQILRLKCTRFEFGCGSAQTPLWELTALPHTSQLVLISVLQRERRGRGGNGRVEKGGEGREWDRWKGRGPQALVHIPMFEILKNTVLSLSRPY